MFLKRPRGRIGAVSTATGTLLHMGGQVFTNYSRTDRRYVEQVAAI